MRHIYVLGDSTPDRKNLIEVTFEREGLHGNPPVIHKEMFCLEKIQQRKPVLRRIRELYDAGVPFFTKDMLKAAVAERDRIIRAQVDKPHVQLRGLDRQVGYDAHMSLVVKFVDGEMRHAFDDDLDSR
jgi:hypothetical protein